jgi:pyruvate dehydrogenase E1 component beta subunit
VLFLEPTRLYRMVKQDVVDDGVALPLDQADLLSEGDDVTLVSWGAMIHETRQAAALLAQEGISCEIIDLTSLSPIDHDTILESVAHTGRLVIVHEAARTAGLGAEIAATVAEQALYDLLAPVQRVTGYDTVMPYFALERTYIPSVARIVDAVRETLKA